MIGFLFGTLCLFGLYHVLRHDGGLPWRRRHRRGGGLHRRFFMQRLFARLETTPAQERVISAAISDVEEEFKSLRNHKERVRDELSSALREESLPSERLETIFGDHEGAISAAKASVAKALSDVHGALEPYQRRLLAQLLEERGMNGRCHARGML